MTLIEKPTAGRISLAPLQKFGRSLMLPIAALPAAGLLLRLGQPDVLGSQGLGLPDWFTTPIAAAGGALFANLPILFALGIAIGMARKADGSTALAAVVGYLSFKGVSDAISPLVLGKAAAGETQSLINYGVLGGIVMGLLSAWLWQRFHRTQLPPYLAFFGGRRMVPILTSVAGMLVAIALGLVYPTFDNGLTAVSAWVATNTVLGGFVYGFLNRLLLPLGLHHIINSPLWFIIGSYTDPTGQTWHGDIARFLHGDPSAGTFMTGYFPIMMFALPAAALAIWRQARPENRKVVGGIMMSVALTSFLTGITEPIEFAFMFVAWPLFIAHAFLTGTSLAICNALGAKMGFGFSAGLIDYLINFRIGTIPLIIIPIGLGYALVYYFLFSFIIKKFNLKTPGRDEGEVSVSADPTADTAS